MRWLIRALVSLRTRIETRIATQLSSMCVASSISVTHVLIRVSFPYYAAFRHGPMVSFAAASPLTKRATGSIYSRIQGAWRAWFPQRRRRGLYVDVPSRWHEAGSPACRTSAGALRIPIETSADRATPTMRAQQPSLVGVPVCRIRPQLSAAGVIATQGLRSLPPWPYPRPQCACFCIRRRR